MKRERWHLIWVGYSKNPWTAGTSKLNNPLPEEYIVHRPRKDTKTTIASLAISFVHCQPFFYQDRPPKTIDFHQHCPLQGHLNLKNNIWEKKRPLKLKSRWPWLVAKFWQSWRPIASCLVTQMDKISPTLQSAHVFKDILKHIYVFIGVLFECFADKDSCIKKILVWESLRIPKKKNNNFALRNILECKGALT